MHGAQRELSKPGCVLAGAKTHAYYFNIHITRNISRCDKKLTWIQLYSYVVCKTLQLCLTFCDPHGLWPARLLCPRDSPGKNTGVVCHILQEIFPIQGSLTSPALTGGFFTTSATWEACKFMLTWKKYDTKTLTCEYSKITTFVAQPIKESTCNVGDPGSIPGLGRSPGEGKGYLLQYSGLENFMDCIVHAVANNWTRLNDFHFTKITTRDEEKGACLSCNYLQNNMKQNEKNVIHLCMFSQNIWSHSKDINKKEKLGIKIRVI